LMAPAIVLRPQRSCGPRNIDAPCRRTGSTSRPRTREGRCRCRVPPKARSPTADAHAMSRGAAVSMNRFGVRTASRPAPQCLLERGGRLTATEIGTFCICSRRWAVTMIVERRGRTARQRVRCRPVLIASSRRMYGMTFWHRYPRSCLRRRVDRAWCTCLHRPRLRGWRRRTGFRARRTGWIGASGHCAGCLQVLVVRVRSSQTQFRNRRCGRS
jgi:hypothetical protein